MYIISCAIPNADESLDHFNDGSNQKESKRKQKCPDQSLHLRLVRSSWFFLRLWEHQCPDHTRTCDRQCYSQVVLGAWYSGACYSDLGTQEPGTQELSIQEPDALELGAQESSTWSPVLRILVLGTWYSGAQYSGVWYSEPGSSLGSLRNVLSSNSQALVWGVWKASHRGDTSQCSGVLGTRKCVAGAVDFRREGFGVRLDGGRGPEHLGLPISRCRPFCSLRLRAPRGAVL